MSELTKIASILFKNLSDALLSTASELSRLDTPAPLSQAEYNPELVIQEPPEFTKREHYKIGDRIMVSLDDGLSPVKMKVSHVLKGAVYLAYFQGHLKSSGREIRHEQILGLDPDR
ncbi:MAG: hypothetical protein ACK5VA_08625 [Pseudanabaena sp.]